MASQYPPDVKGPAPDPTLQHPALTDQSRPVSPGHTRGKLRGFLAGGLLCAAAVYSLRGLGSSYLLPAVISKNGEALPGQVQDDAEEEKFDWLKIIPTEEFEFHSCFGDYQCARLAVPLNWNSTSRDDEKLALAVIKYPAKVPVTDPRYAGPILTNPGGPSNSGVSQMLKTGKHHQIIADSGQDPNVDLDGSTSKENKYYDIISFDPRGVGATTPRMACFPDLDAQGNWAAQAPSPFLLEASDASFHQTWARSWAFGEACAMDRKGDGGKTNIIYYMNTPQVVEDMLAIVDRHAQWREREAKRVIAASPTKLTLAAREEIMSRSAFRKGSELLSYYGVSYGTLLGQTFATMHPDRVGRVILDAVVDAADYYALGWTTNLQDTDRILVAWYDYCMASGSKEKCPFYVETAPPGYFPARVAHSTSDFMKNPKPLPSGDEGASVFGYHDIMDYLTSSLYQPYAMAEDIVHVLDWKGERALEKAVARKKQSIPVRPSQKCIEAGPWSETCINEQGDRFSGTGILCSDGPSQSNLTKEEFKEYMHLLQSQSDLMGTYWAEIKLSCVGWRARPAWHFNETIGADTANPILFISNTHDPVTPIRNGHAASKLFPGSALLHQNAEGHGFYASPSIDTAKKIRAYWQHGKLPDADDEPTQPEFLPFVGCVNKKTGCSDRSEEDERLWRAVEAMALS